MRIIRIVSGILGFGVPLLARVVQPAEIGVACPHPGR